MSVNYIDIPGRLRSVAIDGQVAGANQLYDDDINLFQSVINQLINTHINDSSIHLNSYEKSNIENISKLISIVGLSPFTCSSEKTTNPEWDYVLIDASTHILAGIRHNSEIVVNVDIDEILTYVTPAQSLINVQPDWNETDTDSDAYILNKPTSLPASDVSAWAKQSTKPTYTKSEVGLGNVTNDSQVKRSEMGVANGVATLDSNGTVPSSQLPSYVDDVLEYDSSASFPNPGTAGKIYVDKSDNNTYRWSGTIYVEISKSIVIGTTTGTALDGSVGNSHINNSNIHVTSTDKDNWNGKADKTATVSTVEYDANNKKITKTINGTKSDVVSASTIVTDGGGIKSHQTVTDGNPTLSWGQTSKVATIGSTDIHVKLPSNPNSDTKNTAGSTNNNNKLFLIGALTQAANPQTYSRSNCYIDSFGYIYSRGSRTVTFDDTFTADQIGFITAIASLAENAGEVSVITHQEYQWLVLDASSHIIMGARTDGTFYAANIDALNEALNIMINSYSGQKHGTFNDKPTNPFIGQQYFCDNKQTTEGATNGIPIWYNGSDWVDALGRTIS